MPHNYTTTNEEFTWYFKKHTKEIVSIATEKKTKKPKSHKIQLKDKFSSHQGTQKVESIKFNYRVVVMTHSLILYQG